MSPIPSLPYAGASAAGGGARAITVNPKVVLIIVAVFIVIIAGVGILVLGEFGTGYKTTITGTVTNPCATCDWTLTNLEYSTPVRDYKILNWWDDIFNPKTGSAIIETSFGTSTKIEGVGQWGGSNTFSIEVRHLAPGPYDCEVIVYEEKCGFLPFNCDKEEKTDGYIEIIIEGE